MHISTLLIGAILNKMSLERKKKYIFSLQLICPLVSLDFSKDLILYKAPWSTVQVLVSDPLLFMSCVTLAGPLKFYKMEMTIHRSLRGTDGGNPCK